jgi:hypothetical protein
MTYNDWIEQAERVRVQYYEGAITAREYFNKTTALAMEVVQTETDDALLTEEELLAQRDTPAPPDDTGMQSIRVTPAMAKRIVGFLQATHIVEYQDTLTINDLFAAMASGAR